MYLFIVSGLVLDDGDILDVNDQSVSLLPTASSADRISVDDDDDLLVDTDAGIHYAPVYDRAMQYAPSFDDDLLVAG